MSREWIDSFEHNSPGKIGRTTNDLRVKKISDADKSADKKTGTYKDIHQPEIFQVRMFLHENPDDPRILEIWNKSVSMFQKAASLFSHHFEQVEIPYNDNATSSSNSLPGYSYMPNEDNNNNSLRPTLILFTGFDGTQEELYTTSVIPALQRGYNCLTFEGPGQGRVIRQQKINFRHDWEKVVTPVLDFILTEKEESR